MSSLCLLGSGVLAVSVLDHGAFDEETRRTQVDLAWEDDRRLRLVGETAPVASALVGGALAAWGAVLLMRSRRDGEDGAGPESTGTGIEGWVQ